MIAFTFPGQGSQSVGMGKAFHDASPAARSVFEEANDVLGFDLTRLIFDGPAADLALTANTQPAVLTVCVAAAAACTERGLVPTVMAGHSLGEYSALVVAGALGFADAVRTVRKRGQFMQEAVPVGVGAMAAIIGVDIGMVEKICADAAGDEVVGVANINSPLQIVIAGHVGAVNRALALARERGSAKSVLLPVSAPFHCALMSPAAERLRPELDTVSVRDPAVPVVRNVDGGLSRRADAVRAALVGQVASPVRWSDCVRRMAEDGVDLFLEVGPGRVLTGLVRRIVDGAKGVAIEDPGGLEKALAVASGA
jgi:[acyl-carrier-protein] S-malonyltransferase